MNPTDIARSVLPMTSADLSLLSLFWQAHWIVKCVMVGLLICSVWVWAIALDKTFLYARSKRAMDRFEQAFWSGQSLEELYRTLSARTAFSMEAVFVAAMREWKRSFEGTGKSFAGLQMRIEKGMEVAIAREVERLERRLLVLATIGSAGPFIGLFGTVWGIYHALTAIGMSGQASIDKVAGPVGEALIMTAIGLFVAVPAVLGYNVLLRRNKNVQERVSHFTHELHAYLISGVKMGLGMEKSPTSGVKPAPASVAR